MLILTKATKKSAPKTLSQIWYKFDAYKIYGSGLRRNGLYL